MSFKKFILFLSIFFVSLFCFLVIENFTLKFVFSADTIDDDYFVAAKKIYQENKNKHSNKIIIFGSSMAREGIDQKYLQNNFEEFKVCAVPVSSGKPTDFYLMLNNINAVNNTEDKNLVIIPLSLWMFEKKYSGDIFEDPIFKIFFKHISFFNIYRKDEIKAEQFLKNSVAYVSNFYKYNHYLNQIIDHKNLSFWKTANEREKPSAWKDHRYLKSKPESYFSEELKKEKNYIEYSNDNYIWDRKKNIQIRALEKIFSTLESKNIPFIVIDMPVNPCKKKFYEDGVEEDYKKLIKLVIPSGGKFYDYSSYCDKDNFIDFNHLNQKGRSAFSQEIVEIVQENYAF